MDEITRTHEDMRGVLSDEEILAAEDACRTLMGELSEHRGRLVATRSETACARCLRDDLGTAATTRLEAFKASPLAGRAGCALIAAAYFLALVFYFVSFAGGRAAGIALTAFSVVVLAAGLVLTGGVFLGSRKLCCLLPGRVSYNVFSESFPSAKQQDGKLLVIASTHSSPPGSYFANFALVRKVVFIAVPASLAAFLLLAVLKMALGTDTVAKITVFSIFPTIAAAAGIVPLALHFSFSRDHARENSGAGVAAAAAVYRHFLAHPEQLPEGTRVCFVSFGGEYAAHAGSRAFAAAHPEIAGAKAVVIDDITGGRLRVIRKDALRGVVLSRTASAVAERAAKRTGIGYEIAPAEGLKSKLNALHGYAAEALAAAGCDAVMLSSKDYSAADEPAEDPCTVAARVFDFVVNLAAEGEDDER